MARRKQPAPARLRAGIVAKPTLRTIAEAAGLAVTTVSRALKDEPAIARETRERVRVLAEQMGYVPDRAAQRLRTGRTNVISLVLYSHREILGYGNSLIDGLTQALRDTPYHLVVTPQFEESEPEAPVRYIMRNRLADGIIISRTRPLDGRVRLLLENDFPFVCHGRTELATPHPFVDYDNYDFAYRAARRLIEKGRRKLAIINAPDLYTFSQHLLHGFMSAVRESGVGHEVAPGLSLESPPDDIRRYVMERLGARAVDGFICSGEVSAMAVMAGIVDSGLSIGGEADIVAKQTTPLFNQLRPQIDTIYEDLTHTGRMLGELLLRRLAGEEPATLQFMERPEPRFRG